MTATRRSARPSPRPQPREIDEDFARLVEDWLREPASAALGDTELLEDDLAPPATTKDEGPSRVSIGLVGVLAFIFVFGALFGLAAFHSVLVQNQLRLDRLSSDVEREQARYQSLRIEYGQAAAPFRVLAQASARGMLQSKSKEPLQAVLPEQGDLHGPSTHPFGNVRYFVPPVVSAPPTQTTAPTTVPTTTAAVSAPTSTTVPAATTRPSVVPASSAPTTSRPSAAPTTTRPSAATTTTRPSAAPASTVTGAR